MKRVFEGKTRLQGVGEVEGICAINVRVGDRRVWNGGSSSEVVRVEPSKTGKTVKITTLWFNDRAYFDKDAQAWVGQWEEDTRTCRANQIIAVAELNPAEEVEEVEEVKVETVESLSAEIDTLEVEIEKAETLEERYRLRDIQNELKWRYASMLEMQEKEELERKSAKAVEIIKEDYKIGMDREYIEDLYNKAVELYGEYIKENTPQEIKDFINYIVEEDGYMVQEYMCDDYIEEYKATLEGIKRNNKDLTQEALEMLEDTLDTLESKIGKWVCRTAKLDYLMAKDYYISLKQKNNIGSKFRLIKCKIKYCTDSGFILMGQEPEQFKILEE